MPKRKPASKKPKRSPFLLPALVVAGLLILSFALSWFSFNFLNVSSWLSFFSVLAISTPLFFGAWRVLRGEKPPRWLLFLTIGAALLRLALGAVWFFALPAGGYDTEVQQAGYVMEDAFNRDRAAWDLSQSQQPLTISFQGFSSTDQYGGLLFISAAIYRFLGGAEHQPLLVLTLAAAVSGLAVAFTWAFSRRVWGEKVAHLASWGLALYPEAILLGSSQMREAFLVCLVPLALYALLRVKQNFNASNLALLIIPILLSVPISWAFTPSLLLMLALAYFALDNWRLLRLPKAWLVFVAVAAIIIVGLFLFADVSNMWLVQSAKWQAYVSANASGWVARQFERLPVYGQVPFLVIYGLFRPILPAALVDAGPPVWTAIGIWRALGWTGLLALLVYATYLAFRSKEWLRLPGALLLSSWIVSLTASYRGGGDLWDSPRYRSAFAAIQVALAAWAWVRYRETKDPWLRRAIGATLLMIAWFVPWYLRRYTPIDWPIVELYQTVGLGLVSAALYVIWDWMGEK